MIEPSRRREIIEEILTPNRTYFDEVSIQMRFLYSGSSTEFLLDYIIEFAADLDEVIFGIASSPLVQESMHSLIEDLTECTAMQPGQNIADAYQLLQTIEVSSHSNGRTSKCQWEIIDDDDCRARLPADSTLSVNDFRLARAQFNGDRKGKLRRIQIRIRRRIPYSAGGLPWISDRLLFLRSLTVDYTQLPEAVYISPQIFLNRYANAHEIGEWDQKLIRLQINAWLVSGQGVMFTWLDQERGRPYRPAVSS